MANTPHIREMTRQDGNTVAALIRESTNRWYVAAGKAAIFQGGDDTTAVFCDVYDALPGSGGLVAEIDAPRKIVGSCFYHERPTHVSLGIMNVHPDHFGQGIAVRLLDAIIDLADAAGKPLRLVSSAMNLDSYSLYTRRGFVPRAIYQDMLLTVPDAGFSARPPLSDRVRPAVPDDVARIGALEESIAHIRRETDYAHFIENRQGFWHVSVIEDEAGALAGVMASSSHPACTMIGPGAARTEAHALALLVAELDRHRGRTPVFLVPADQESLVRSMYKLGARNCELHFSQVRGHWPGLEGLLFPTFLPESA